MKIVCSGGGPAGLYFAISAKRRDAGHDITVLERDPVGATYGWGIVYWDNLLDMLYRNDMDSARHIRVASRLFHEQEIRVGDRVAYLPGYGYSITRARLLEILTARARALGVDVRHDHPVADETLDADIVVAADGAGSGLRRAQEHHFGTRRGFGRNRYIWLGTTKLFDRFTFAFERTSAGWMWIHGYPSSADTSTCIVECTAETWQGNGFDTRNTEDTLRLLEKIFAGHLQGHALISDSRGEAARWLGFRQITNEVWYHDNLVLLGDAAHTTHFTIGSGTRLAMIDAASLAQALFENPDPRAALAHYDQRRRAALRTSQASARTSMAWFENVENYLEQDVTAFAYSLSSRLGQEPPWRYQKYLATQIPVARGARRHYDNATRWYRACKRGEHALIPPSSVPAG